MRMQIPKRPKPLKRKKSRDHLPAYTQLQREMVQLRMEANPLIPPAVSRALMASFNAAANPGAETPESAIASMQAEDRTAIRQAAQGYSQIFDNAGMRGRNALLMDSSLDELISQSDE